nr:MAG TPA: hypothetical protein [Caudoviricetes sp.]
MRTNVQFLCFIVHYIVTWNIIKVLILQGFRRISCIYWCLRIFKESGSSPASGTPKALSFQGFFLL